MFEARLPQGILLKKILEAVKELVADANFDCSETGVALQAMDTSHVALVALLLRNDAFDPFRCDRSLSLGINLNSLNKILKCAGNEDIITLKADDTCDTLDLVFESTIKDKISSYQLKLMDIDSEHMGIPDDVEYEATVILASSEFQQICRDLSALSDSVTIEVSKTGVHFTATGELGNGCITLKQGSASIDDHMMDVKEEVDEIDEEDMNQGSSSKRRRKDEKVSDIRTQIIMTQPIALCFSLKYLSNFSKATPLASSVKLQLSSETPLVVEYIMNDIGFLKYFLAPKIDES